MRCGASAGKWMLNSSGKAPLARAAPPPASAIQATANVASERRIRRFRQIIIYSLGLRPRAAKRSGRQRGETTRPAARPAHSDRGDLGEKLRHRPREPDDHEAVVLPDEPDVVVAPHRPEPAVGRD